MWGVLPQNMALWHLIKQEDLELCTTFSSPFSKAQGNSSMELLTFQPSESESLHMSSMLPNTEEIQPCH